jgi:hypothetical protein
MNVIKNTKTICPECLKALDATIFEDDGKVYIKKNAPSMALFRSYTGQVMSSINGQKSSGTTATAWLTREPNRERLPLRLRHMP